MIGQRLGSFLIEEKVGSGAMGVVFRALHEKTGRTAAVKIITGEAGQKAKVPERFEREAKILESFRHPNIVRFLARGRFAGTNYVAMEYLTGGTLEDLLDRRTFLPWQETLDYAIQICDALHYAHERQIIHRDLKPSNLLFSDSGQIKLTDFGIAKDDSEDAEALTATGRTLGTAAYMAPEQIKGEPKISHKTDLYALGCMLFQMLTGQTPFRGASPVVLMHMHLSEKAPRVSTKNPDVPRVLDDLILALMAKDPSRRPFDAEKVCSDLKELKARVARGEAVPSVFAGGDLPTRPGIAVAGPSPTTSLDQVAPTSGALRAGAFRDGRSRLGSALSELASDPERLKTFGLAGALVAGLALTAYLLWPPGAAALYRQAEAMMASPQAGEWRRADREVLSELDRRFPDLYVEQKQAWRDRIELEKTRGRAGVLENLTALSKPKPGVEEIYVDVYREATRQGLAGRDEDATRAWEGLARALKSDDPEQKPWRVLAEEKAQGLRAAMAARRKDAIALLDKADDLARQGKDAEAAEVRKDAATRFGTYVDLRDLLRDRGVGAPGP